MTGPVCADVSTLTTVPAPLIRKEYGLPSSAWCPYLRPAAVAFRAIAGSKVAASTAFDATVGNILDAHIDSTYEAALNLAVPGWTDRLAS